MNNEEKLKEAKRLYQMANFDQRYVLESLFPELKESEDEKIRKYLLKLADRCPEDSIDFMREVKKGDIIAWLEKQGEKKSSDKVLKIRQEVYQSGYNDGYKHGIEDVKQGEQKETLCDKCRKEQPSHSCQDITSLGRCALEKQGEQTINQPDFEIPFGASDSELIEESYYIPKGYHAEISKDKVTIKKGEQKTNSQNVQDLIEKYVSDHADCRWLDASELEQLLNDFVLEYDEIKNREYEQQYKVSNDWNNR